MNSSGRDSHMVAPFSAKMSRGDKLLLLLGVVAGVVWFIYCIQLPGKCRGFTIGDSSVYLRLSDAPLSQVFFHSCARAFGYPFYLSVFRYLSNNGGFFLPAALGLQLLLHFGSMTFLFYSLRRAGLKLPWAALGLLYAHPAFTGFAAITLSESLTTSLTSVMIGILIFLTREERHFIFRSVALGFIASITLAIRPPAAMFLNLFWVFSAVALYSSAYGSSKSIAKSLRRFAAFLFLYGIGFLPVYGHLLNNCYQKHNQRCIIPSPGIDFAIVESLERAQAYSRIWGIVGEGSSFQWGQTEDRVLGNCKITIERPTSDMIDCYSRNIALLPRYWFARLIGLFDHRHLNPNCALETPPIMFWTLRILSAVGLIGLVAAAALFFSPVVASSWGARSFLLVPFLSIGLQVNLHPETRYILPVVPLLFALGTASLTSNVLGKRWLYWLVLAISVVLLGAFFSQVVQWDALAWAHYKCL